MIQAFCYLFSRRDRVRFLLLVASMVLGSLVELLTLGAVPFFVSVLVGQRGLPDEGWGAGCLAWLGIQNLRQFAVWGSLGLIGLFFFRTLMFIGSIAFQERVLRNRQIALGTRLFNAYMRAPYSLLRTRNSSIILNYVCHESLHLIEEVLNPALNILRNLLCALVVLGLLLWFEPLISLSAFAALALFGAATMLFVNSRNRRLGEIELAGAQGSVKAVSQGIGVCREAIIAGCRSYFTKVLHAALERQANAQKAINILQRSVWPMMELLTVCVLMGAMGIMLLAGREIQDVAPVLALLGVCLARLKGCVTEIMIYFGMIRRRHASTTQVAGELRLMEAGQGRALPCDEQVEPLPFKDCIAVNDLCYAYPDAKQNVLNHLSFTIRQGQSIGFIGATGSGKSTMATLLLGLLEPSSGTITVDGNDIARNMPAWQRLLGYVPQDIYLLDDTIQANIALGIPPDKVNQEALKAAIAAASLEEFIASLPNGVNTLIGERGTRLSGGQRQRVGIARALYLQPQILIFDEATSALDNDTEAAVMAAIEKLQGTHTLIIVAHRLTTIRHCDAVLKFS